MFRNRTRTSLTQKVIYQLKPANTAKLSINAKDTVSKIRTPQRSTFFGRRFNSLKKIERQSEEEQQVSQNLKAKGRTEQSEQNQERGDLGNDRYNLLKQNKKIKQHNLKLEERLRAFHFALKKFQVFRADPNFLLKFQRFNPNWENQLSSKQKLHKLQIKDITSYYMKELAKLQEDRDQLFKENRNLIFRINQLNQKVQRLKVSPQPQLVEKFIVTSKKLEDAECKLADLDIMKQDYHKIINQLKVLKSTLEIQLEENQTLKLNVVDHNLLKLKLVEKQKQMGQIFKLLELSRKESQQLSNRIKSFQQKFNDRSGKDTLLMKQLDKSSSKILSIEKQLTSQSQGIFDSLQEQFKRLSKSQFRTFSEEKIRYLDYLHKSKFGQLIEVSNQLKVQIHTLGADRQQIIQAFTQLFNNKRLLQANFNLLEKQISRVSVLVAGLVRKGQAFSAECLVCRQWERSCQSAVRTMGKEWYQLKERYCQLNLKIELSQM